MAESVGVNIFSSSYEDLRRIKGVGDATLRKLKTMVDGAYKTETEITVELLASSFPNVDWAGLVSSGALSLERPEHLTSTEEQLRQPPALELLRDMSLSMRSLAEKFDVLEHRISKVESGQGGIHGELRKLHQRVDEVESKQFVGGGSALPPFPFANLPPPSFMMDQGAVPKSSTPIKKERCPPSAEEELQAEDRAKQFRQVQEMKNLVDRATVDGVFRGGDDHHPDREGRRNGRSQTVQQPDLNHDTFGQEQSRVRERSKSPQGPRMQLYSGDPAGTKFDVFVTKFNRIAYRRNWSDEKKFDKFLDCMSEQALEYANHSSATTYDGLIRDMAARFDFREEPVSARQKLAVIKQGEETDEEFLQSIQSLANDGYRGRHNAELDSVMTEAFLRGLRNKQAALEVLGKAPATVQEALRLVKAYRSNMKVIGLDNNKQVTFEQKAVSILPSDSVKELSDSILKGLDRLLESHLGRRSKWEPSSQDRYFNRSWSPRHTEQTDRPRYSQGRDRNDRYRESRSRASNRSPSPRWDRRDQERRGRSPSPYPRYRESPSRTSRPYQDSRWENRSSVRDREFSQERDSRPSSRDRYDYPRRNDRSRQYEARAVSPAKVSDNTQGKTLNE